MINEDKIKQLLEHTHEFIALANEHEDEGMLDINHNIYDKILDEIGIENDFNKRDEYYEIFAEHHFGFLSDDEVVNKLKELTKTT